MSAINTKELRNLLIAFALGWIGKAVFDSIWNSLKSNKKEPTGLYVGIELGGTNYNVAIGEAVRNREGKITNFNIVKRKSGITYEDPNKSIQEIVEFIAQSQPVVNQKPQDYAFIGIASFGPLCLDKTSDFYGAITTTPKQAWRGMKVLKRIKQPFGSLAGIQTDVNAAAYAQYKIGGHKVRQSLAYVTVGTGVGVGVVANGKTVHGLTHPQGGHMIVERSQQQFQQFLGVCSFHSKRQTCLQGMVCNKSIAQRLKVDFTALAQIPDDSKVWKLVAFYLAQLCLNITLLLSPEVIVIGGGIMNRKLLYGLIHEEFKRLLGGYIQHDLYAKDIDQYIVAPRLGADVGVKGAMLLSQIQN